MIRLFAAIGIPEQIRQRLMLLQGGIPGARWSAPENLHITLRFIGEVDDVTASDIDGMLETLHMPAFDLSLKGVGLFGGKDPHSLWIGVAPCEALTRLAAKIESLLQRMGLEPDARKYMPHVTIARLKDVPQPRLNGFIADHAVFDSAAFSVRDFGLYSSHPTAHGSQYLRERSYALE